MDEGWGAAAAEEAAHATSSMPTAVGEELRNTIAKSMDSFKVYWFDLKFCIDDGVWTDCAVLLATPSLG